MIRVMRGPRWLVASAFIVASCAHTQNGADWATLFDGTTASAWRGYLKTELPGSWQVIDGTLAVVEPGGGDIITKQQFDNFELQLEWKIAPGGNSGIFFRVKEDAALKYAYLSAAEMQVLDNTGHPDGNDPKTSAGSNFALHAPIRDVTRVPGEWNQVRLIVNGSHVEHWLNGVKLLEYELWTDEWNRMVANSKFKTMPAYAKASSGHIALQDHGGPNDRVAYRNIRIRPIRSR